MKKILVFFMCFCLAAPLYGATARRNATASGGQRVTVARSAGRTTTGKSAPKKTLAARAGATQKVIGTGTKVAVAQENVVTNKSCQEKYSGCMDALCMIDNTSGGRCICSNRIFELDKLLTQIELADTDSYKLATMGVESIETGVDIAVADVS